MAEAMRMRLPNLVLLLLLLAALIAADSVRAEGFKTPCADCWPGFVDYQTPASGSQISVAEGAGRITVKGVSWAPEENVQHLLVEGSEGARSINSELSFESLQGNQTYFALFSSPIQRLPGERWGLSVCAMGRDGPPWASDAAWLVTLFDDGERWVGAYVGAEHAVEGAGLWPFKPPARIMTSFGLLQRHEGVTYELAHQTMLPPIHIRERFRLRALSDGAKVSATVWHGTRQKYSARKRLIAAPDIGARAGLIARTAKHSLCSRGGFLRDFAAYSVDAR